jgi:hypothetical protein
MALREWPNLDPALEPEPREAWQALCHALDFLKGAFIGAHADAASAATNAKLARDESALVVEWLKALTGKVDKMIAAREAPITPVPPRPELDSSHNLGEFAQKVERAALEGYKRQDSTPEAMVAEVVAEFEKKRERDREFKRLQQAELDRQAEDARRAADAQQAAKDRAAFRRNIVIAIMGGGGAFTGAIEAVRALL